VPPRASKYIIQFPKVTKPLVPNKLNLEVALDDAKLFRQPSKSLVERPRPGLITVEPFEDTSKDQETIDYEELFKARSISQRDIQMAVADWNIEMDSVDGAVCVDRPFKVCHSSKLF